MQIFRSPSDDRIKVERQPKFTRQHADGGDVRAFGFVSAIFTSIIGCVNRLPGLSRIVFTQRIVSSGITRQSASKEPVPFDSVIVVSSD